MNSIRVCCIVALGGFLFGYDWVVIGGAKPFYELYFRITESQWMQGWAMSGALIGCLVGSAISMLVADRVGRKPLLLVSALLFLVSAIGSSCIDSIELFIVFRMVGGVGIGLASNLSPMLIAELSPSAIRGRLVSLNQLTIVLGILAAQVVNYLIAQDVLPGAMPAEIRESWNGQFGWRWMFGAQAIPASLFLLLLLSIPESPRWLFTMGRHQQASDILVRLWGKDSAGQIIQEIEANLALQHRSPLAANLWTSQQVIKALLLGSLLALLQQWSGINVVFNYADTTDHSKDNKQFNRIDTGTADRRNQK